MRSTMALLVFGFFLFAAASPGLAAGPKSFYGDISNVDSAAKTLVVKNKAKPAQEMSFQLAPYAKVTMDGKALELAGLKKGEHVKVTYADEGMHHKAEKIEVMAPKTAAAKPRNKSMAP